MSKNEKRRKNYIKTLFIVFSILAPIFTIELISTAYYHFFIPKRLKSVIYYQLTGDTQYSGYQNCVPHPFALYMPTPNYTSVGFHQNNALGFRGKEIPAKKSKFRIVCMGGSTTYCTKINDPSKAYPAMLEKYLNANNNNVEVINAGLPNGCSAEILSTLLFRVLSLEPDLIVLNAGGNDMVPFVTPGYKDDYSHFHKNWVLPEILPINKILMMSRTYRLIYLTFFLPKTYSEIMIKDRGSRSMDFYYDLKVEDFKGLYPTAFKRNVENMILVCKARGIKFALVNFKANPYNPAYFGTPVGKYVIEKLHYSIFDELSKKYDVPLAHFENLKIPEKLWALKDACHLNADGSKLKAAFIGDVLIKNGVLN